ncbi:MAG: arabinan endo,5-alpha-L-arabinosidase [Acidobacteriota bacterium]|jgi:arabinan endo-1,5-alpha-L-arabinosidase|nr:arabinan endo,5-alpha-L-arabinosidase [Acidobacteriota bacterium]
MRKLLSVILFFALAAVAPNVAAQRRSSAPQPHAATYINPVFDEDFPDPTVIDAGGGWFYAYATQTDIGGRVLNFQSARSRDLIHWERVGDALPVKPVWASQTQLFWAPDVHRRGQTFFMYFSAGLDPDRAAQFKKEQRAEKSLEGVFCLGVATASRPEGPFRDSGRPLKCGLSFVNIDPMAFDDPLTDRKYLYWGSGFQPIRVQELAADRLSFKQGSAPVELVSPDKNVPFQTLIEGAWVVYRKGFYYLFYSGENCCHGPLQEIKYAALVARSKSPTGPFQTLAQATSAPDSGVVRRSDMWIAPGHNSIVTDDMGQDWIAYHAINFKRPYMTDVIGGDRSVRRVMLLDRVVWRDGWPRVESGTPSSTAVPAPSVRMNLRVDK